MATAQETLKDTTRETFKPKKAPVFNRALDFVSSVRFGVTLLCILVAFSMVGMLIVQQNVNGFDAFYASLTPAEKTVYSYLGIFDIYHGWYFNFLLLILSLNIVLASIDRFPSAWSYISRPKIDGSKNWLLNQKQNAVAEVSGINEKEIVEKISRSFKANGFTPRVSEKNNQVFVFAEKGKWNRLGAYIVHVALLTLFLGHFVALQTGFDADVRMMPGQTTSEIQMIEFNLDRQDRYVVGLPFSIYCTDIEQNLIDPKGSIEISNTLNWHTRIEIDDPEYGKTVADVSLNKPFAYRGYRFFQASAITVGSARSMTLEAVPQNGGDPVTVNLARNGSTNLPDGTKVGYEAFFPDFVLKGAQPDTRSAAYNNPAVKLNFTTPGGEQRSGYAFGRKMPDNIPIGAPVAGYKWRLVEFEKSPLAHVLSIKYDPFNAAFIAWYIGGFGLIGALCFVFFISHRRVWASITRTGEESFEIVFAGHANRNVPAFEDKFDKITGGFMAINRQSNPVDG